MPKTGHRALTGEQARAARFLFADDKVPMGQLAVRFDVHRVTMRAILRGDTYKDAGGPIISAPPARTVVDDERAHEMRDLRANGAKLDDLAWLFETTTSNVHLIVTGKTHRSAGGPITAVRGPTTSEDVIEIRQMRFMGYSYVALSLEFGKSEVALRSICCGKSFPKVGGPLVPKKGRS